jgi:translation initiation factor IF-3
MEVLGKVKLVTPMQQVSEAYNKRELVVKTDEQYPQSIMIEFGQGKCNEYLDKLQVGDQVKVSINLGGREWVNPQGETKYFNSIKGWKVEKMQVETTNETPATNVNTDEPDDLPY